MNQFAEPRDPKIDRAAAVDAAPERREARVRLEDGKESEHVLFGDAAELLRVGDPLGPVHMDSFGKALGQVCDSFDDPPAAALCVVRGMLAVFQPYDRKIVLACLEGDQGTAEREE